MKLLSVLVDCDVLFMTVTVALYQVNDSEHVLRLKINWSKGRKKCCKTINNKNAYVMDKQKFLTFCIILKNFNSALFFFLIDTVDGMAGKFPWPITT